VHLPSHAQAYLEAAAAKLGLLPVRFDPDDRTVSKLSRRPLDHAFVRGAVVENAGCRGSTGSDHVALTFDLVCA
jgi:endonuclease/exonuclease/phosphatase (EEP) superfamily protein YafD